MMDGIRTYLLQITSAAMFCCVTTSILGKKGLLTATVKLLAGVIMALAVVAPWVNVRLDGFDSFLNEISIDASNVVADGEFSAMNELKAIIKRKTEAYILDKADAFGARIVADVSLSEDAIPVPTGVRISGNYSPYAKSVISAYITDDIGIKLEEQVWIP